MSTPPPSNPPPGGFPLPPQGGPPPGVPYYGGPPPGRPANNNAGCLKAFGITCGVLLLLAVIGGVVGVISVRNAMKNPHSLFGTAMSAGKAGMNGSLIRQAIVRYHEKNGKYPQQLMDLVTDGETDGKIFHDDLDTNTDPAHVSWQYTPPNEGDPGSTPILTQDYTLSVGTTHQKQTIVINLDGTTRTKTEQSYGQPAPSSGGASSP